MAKRQDVLSLRIPVPLALPAAPNPKAANTPIMTSGHIPATCSHHHPPRAGQPLEVPEEFASGSGLAGQRPLRFHEPRIQGDMHSCSPLAVTMASFVLGFPRVPLNILVPLRLPLPSLLCRDLERAVRWWAMMPCACVSVCVSVCV